MITLTRTPFVCLLLAGAASVSAQTPAPKPPVHTTTTPHTTTAAHPTGTATTAAAKPVTCSTDIPELSPKIPALPAGSPCPKPLYTITTEPPAKLTYVSPVETTDIRTALGLEGASFSLSYIDTKVGAGELAKPGKFYTIHYTGYLTDGSKFDSSVDRGDPITIEYGKHEVIPGWDTGFDGMHVGGKRRLFIPYQLAYGPSGRPPTIPARAELVFDVELLSQSDTPPAPKAPPAAPAKPAAEPSAQPATPPPAKPAGEAEPAK